MKLIERFHCPVVWKCHVFNEVITVEPDAICNVQKGWICKCGKFVKKDTRSHEISLWGLRKGIKREPGDKIAFLSRIEAEPVCCECGNPTSRSILGVFVCKDCYSYDYSDSADERSDCVIDPLSCAGSDGVTSLGIAILECSIEFDPELLICKGCERFRDCKTHHVVISKEELSKNHKLTNYQ